MQLNKEDSNASAFRWDIIFSRESIGLALAKLWPYLVFFGSGVYCAKSGGGDWLDFSHIISLATLATALCLSPILIEKLKPTTKTLSVFSIVLYGVGTALLFIPVIFEDFNLVLLSIGGLLTGLGSASLNILWGNRYSELPARESLGSAAIAYVLAAVLFYGVIQLPQAALFLAMELCPLMSVSILSNISVNTQSMPSFNRSPIPPAFRKIFCGIFIFGFISGVMHKMPMIGLDDKSTFLSSEYLIASLFDFVIIFLFERLSKQFNLSNLYKLGTFIIAAAVIVSPLFDWSLIVFRMGYVFFSFVIWIRLADITNKYKLSSCSVYGIGLGLLYFGLLIGDASIYSLSGILDFSNIVTKFIVSSTITIVVLFAFYLGLHEMKLPKKDERATYDDVSAKCFEVAAKYKLSKRQEEVLCLLVQGRSAKMIQEHLYLSAGTVNTHVTAIYHKLNIHSRDELIKLIEKIDSKNS